MTQFIPSYMPHNRTIFNHNHGLRIFQIFIACFILGICSIAMVTAQAPATTCAGAPLLTQNGACGSGTISDAVLEPGCNNANVCSSLQPVSREGWYRFQALTTSVTIAGTAGNRNICLQLYSGVCGALVEIDCDNSTTTIGADLETVDAFGLTIGAFYYVRVGNVSANNMTLTSLCITTLVPASNDNSCGAFPLAVGTSCSYATYNNFSSTPTIGLSQPGCGSFGALTNDVWFSAVVPANGTLTIQATDAAAMPGNMYPSVAFYTGTCGTLEHAGCAFSVSLITPTTATYVGPPGSTVYIRVWDYYDTENSFDICAYTHSNAMGGIFAEATNTITCGGPAVSFTDPGGSGNYAVNSSALYTICPSVPGQFVTVTFTSFALETNFDFLTVIDGSGPDDPIIANYTGGAIPATVTSSAADGCLSFAFRSDVINALAGWTANVTCSPTPGVNTFFCSTTNCSGECGTWICADGLFPTSNSGSVGVQELNEQIAGCLGGAGEVATAWFYFTALSTGTIELSFDGPNGQDYDFAIWGPDMTGEPPCPLNTGNSPIRCSFADVANTANPVGLIDGAGDTYEGAEGNGWVEDLDVIAGETYAMVLNIYMNGNPQPIIDLDIGGTGTLDCTPLPIELLSFDGAYDAGHNRIRWVSASEYNNSYYTLMYSSDGVNYEVLNTQNGAGNSNIPIGYSYSHVSPYSITYYKLRQTDYDGKFKEFGPISISKLSNGEDFTFNYYPNPATDMVSIYTTFGGDCTLKLVNSLGQIVKTQLLNGAGLHSFDLTDLPKGIYILQVESEFGIERQEKLILN